MERLTLLPCEAFNRERHPVTPCWINSAFHDGAGSIVPVYIDLHQLHKSNWKWPKRMHSG